MQHPDYNSANYQNDISILELDQALQLTAYPNIKPICLPASGTTYPNSTATVSGWGTLSSAGNLVVHLNEVDVTVFADGDCGSMNSYMSSDMLCAGVKEGGQDSCQGDSGGPLFTSDPANNGAKTLIGVVSWGFGCAAADQLGIYAEVAHFRGYIDSILPDMNTCGPPHGSELTNSPTTEASTTTSPPFTSSPIPNTSSTSRFGNYVFPFIFASIAIIPYFNF